MSQLYRSFLLRILIAVFFIFPIACSEHKKSNQPDNSIKSFTNLLPVVQKTSFSDKSFSFSGEWMIDGSNDIKETIAYKSLTEALQPLSSGGFKLTNNAAAKIELLLKPSSVVVENNIDSNKASIEQQAYSLHIEEKSIRIVANAPQGLYYGVQTFLQLLQKQDGNILLPEGEITDWPDLSLRIIYWDDAHHLEKMEALKRIIRQASQYKINAFAIKLEGHFEFKTASHLVEPYAVSPEQYQELTDYAKKYFVELVPYLDAPAHVSFMLKHPEYAKLRLYPNNNYEFSIVNKDAVELSKTMFNELLAANKGGKYVVLSTDEAYYAGKGPGEKEAAAKVGGNGKLLAGYIKTIADELNKQGRTVIFWGEYPLTVDDISLLPAHLVTGEYNEMAAAFQKQGIRQLAYTYTQGEEPLFPNYYSIHSIDTVVAESTHSSNRIAGMLKDIRAAVDGKNSTLMGVIIAGWADAGLNPETFWLGYTTGAAMAWNIKNANPEDLARRFFISFYGDEKLNMKRIYELLSTQAEFSDSSWDWVTSDFRKPILGNSEGIFPKPEKVKDQSLPMLPVPSAKNFAIAFDWDSMNKKRLDLVAKYFRENDELTELLHAKRTAEKQTYNWEVLQTIALLCRQNLQMITDLGKANSYLKSAAKEAGADHAAEAVQQIDRAISTIGNIKIARDSSFAFTQIVWYQEWQPLVKEANGRTFLHELDDIKDHRPGRTIDLSYLIYRQLNYPLGKWAEQTLKSRNEYARVHSIPVAENKLDWGKYK
ncbi:MAG: family 20 glycosylhydrolase [Bacteroidetes bacterium]|nr:family 20 glycosylhydrolase [Bacteroidota bacterium]